MPLHIVEYLAYTSKKQIKRLLKNFLTNLNFDMDLLEEYDQNHFYAASNSTYPVTVEVIFHKDSVNACHFRFISESSVSIKSFMRNTSEYWSDFFDELFVVRDDVSRQKCVKSYDPIHQVENDLRHLILKKLRETDIDWEANLPISDSTHEKAKKNMQADREEYGEELVGSHILQYLTLYDLLRIIKEKRSLFTTLIVFDDVKTLEQLRKLRNKIAHNRHISDEDFRNVTRIYSMLKRKIGSELSPFHNPP